MKKTLMVLTSICGLRLLSGCAAVTGPPPPPVISATHFSVTPATSSPTAGAAFMITVTALGASGQTATNYNGTVHFASSDPKAVLPADTTMASVTGTFPITFNTAGSQTITVSDATTTSITGTSNSINVNAYAGVNPVPLINQPLSPDAIIPGGPGFKLTVNGTGFVSGSTVKWNGSARATSFVSEAQVTANILMSDVATANTASVTVVNPGGSSNVVFFGTTNPTSFASWGGPFALSTGTSPSSVATADFNGDANLDIVVTNGGSNNISIILGDGDGTFQTAVNYPAGTNPDSVAVGDFNGDGKLDIVVTNSGSNDVSIFLGKGDGTFQPAVNYTAGTSPSSVIVGDLDGDGKLDLAVANFGSANVSVLLGNGDGTFKTALDYGTEPWASSVAVGDFNGDGKLDLAVANSGSSTTDIGSISILLGNGDGTFRAGVNYLTEGNNSTVAPGASVAVGDFNGDGKLDLAVVNAGSSNFTFGYLSILLGNGDGTFQTAVNYPTLSRSSTVALGDFNGDGKLDLAVSNISGNGSGPSSASVLLGNGDGTFQTAMYHDAGSNPSSVAVGDFNGDGRMDLAVTDQSGSTVSILLYPVLAGLNADLSSSILPFSTQVVGTTSSGNSVLLSNDGTATLSITSISTTTNFGESDNCGSSLAPGASCTIFVTFSPTTINNLTGTLSITDNAPSSPQTASLSGAGTVAELAPPRMNFICLPICGSKTATLTNTAATALSITSITTSSPLVGPSGHAFNETNDCPARLGPGAFCTITVTFQGVANKNYDGTLIVNDNGGASPQTVSLTGIIE